MRSTRPTPSSSSRCATRRDQGARPLHDFDGTVTFDAANPERSSVNLSIKAATIDTSTADRDAHLRSDDFFAVEKHLTLTLAARG